MKSLQSHWNRSTLSHTIGVINKINVIFLYYIHVLVGAITFTHVIRPYSCSATPMAHAPVLAQRDTKGLRVIIISAITNILNPTKVVTAIVTGMIGCCGWLLNTSIHHGIALLSCWSIICHEYFVVIKFFSLCGWAIVIHSQDIWFTTPVVTSITLAQSSGRVGGCSRKGEEECSSKESWKHNPRLIEYWMTGWQKQNKNIFFQYIM